MKLEPPDKQLVYGFIISIFLTVAIIFGLVFEFVSDYSPATIPPEFTATPGLYLTAVPHDMTEQIIEDQLGVALPDEMMSFQAVRICFIDCDYGVKFSASPEAVDSFVTSFDHISLEEGHNPFDAEDTFVFVSFLDWWTPEAATSFVGSNLSFYPKILVDKTNPVEYVVYLTFL